MSTAFQVPTLPTQQQQYDAYGNPIPPAGANSNIYGGALTPPSYPTTRNDSIGAQVNANQNYITSGANQIGNEAGSQLAYYGPQQEAYTGAENAALNNLAATPGYTPEEASQINVNYALSPTQQAAIAGNPNQPVQVANAGANAEGAFLNQEQGEIGSTLGQYQSDLGGATGAFQQGVTGAAGNLNSNLTSIGNNPALAFDPNNTEKQITDQQVQQMETNAGQRIGNQYQTAEDQLQRQAAAAGNTSPMAIAAANSRLQHQEASDQGNAESTAAIQALQAQEQQASNIEQQREGAAFQQTGIQQQGAEFGGAQGIAAQEAAGQAGINSANTFNQTQLGAVTNYGQQAENTAANMANLNYGAANTAENEASSRALALGQNQQGAMQLTSGGAQTVGNARQAGEAAYRSGVAGQEAGAQQGGQNAVTEQQGALSTASTGLNQGTSTLSGYKANAPTVVGQATGLIGAITGHAKGAIITKPEVAKVGEAGPEMIVPLYGRYKRKAA